MSEAPRIVTLTREPDGFLVAVQPAHPDHPPRAFVDYREARGAACGIRLVTRWPIVDECDHAGSRSAGKGR